jgi:hypothetical protein
MRFPHLFEFMDLDWLPSGLRTTLREILECTCLRPFRDYYEWVAGETLTTAREGGFTTIVELGAGTAQITRMMAERPESDGLNLVVTDLNPDRVVYEELRTRYPGKVSAVFTPVDISSPQRWEPKTLVVLSASFHHLPPRLRPKVLQAMTGSAEKVLVFEPLRKTVGSLVYTMFSFIPALIMPVYLFNRPGKLRRFFWCWLFPIAPPMFWWEGMVSCLRMWSNDEWRAHLATNGDPARPVQVTNSAFCQKVAW